MNDYHGLGHTEPGL